MEIFTRVRRVLVLSLRFFVEIFSFENSFRRKFKLNSAWSKKVFVNALFQFSRKQNPMKKSVPTNGLMDQNRGIIH